jgi:hypothetical protein
MLALAIPIRPMFAVFAADRDLDPSPKPSPRGSKNLSTFPQPGACGADRRRGENTRLENLDKPGERCQREVARPRRGSSPPSSPTAEPGGSRVFSSWLGEARRMANLLEDLCEKLRRQYVARAEGHCRLPRGDAEDCVQDGFIDLLGATEPRCLRRRRASRLNGLQAARDARSRIPRHPHEYRASRGQAPSGHERPRLRAAHRPHRRREDRRDHPDAHRAVCESTEAVC